MKGHLALGLGTILFCLLGGAIAWTAGAEKASMPPAFSAKPQGAYLSALTESVARRARELDLADLRVQEERKLLEKMKEEMRKDIAELDRKLSTLEQRNVERSAERKATRQYIAKVFKSMDAGEAAKRMQLLGDRDAAVLMREMKEKDAAKIMAQMEPPFSVAVTRWMEKL
jgi:flagellar motility protein MotE (MotC chaperone)